MYEIPDTNIIPMIPPEFREQAAKSLAARRRQHGEVYRENTVVAAICLASIFRMSKGRWFEATMREVLQGRLIWAYSEYENQPFLPIGINYRVPIISEKDEPLARKVFERCGLAYPPGPEEVEALFRQRIPVDDPMYGSLEGLQRLLLIEMAKRMEPHQVEILNRLLAERSYTKYKNKAYYIDGRIEDIP